MKLTKTSLAIAAVFFCLGSAPVFAADANTLPVEQAEPEVLDATAETTEGMDEVDAANPAMDLAELQAEIRIACEEFAVDEKVADEKVPEFVDACIAENMPADQADAIETADTDIPAIEDFEPTESTAPIVTGQAATQE